MKISHLGPKNTYTGKAAQNIADDLDMGVEMMPMTSLEAVARSLGGGSQTRPDMVVMAYYNFLEGLVQECLDLIYENDLRIIGMHRLPILFSAGKYSGSRDLEGVYSHPKALAQCSGWLSENYPNAKQVPIESTAAGVEKVMDLCSGIAIASNDAIVGAGLEVIGEDIGNKKHGTSNYTDFYLVTKNGTGVDLGYDKDSKYLTMMAITPHFDKSGLLCDILSQVAYYQLNNKKIHSRPAIDNVKIGNNGEPQMFYLEVEAHKDNPDFRKCVDALTYGLTPKGKDVEVVRVLGSYEMPKKAS